MRADPRVDEDARRAAEVYDSLAPEYDQHYVSTVHLAEDEVVRRWLIEGEHLLPVLDLGCGTGNLIDLAEVPPGEYEGLDISPGMVEKARRNHPEHSFQVADMRDLAAYKAGQFGSVVSLFGSFSYVVENPHWALVEMARVLQPGGRLFLMVLRPGYEKRSSYIARGSGLDLYEWTVASLGGALYGAGFEDVRVRGLNRYGDRFGFMSQKALVKYLEAESRYFPAARCWFYVAEAYKP